MAKDKLTDYSATAASNTDIGGVGIQGTNAISNIDNAVREVMSHLAETNAGTYPVADTWSFADPADLTKRFRLDGGGVTAGQTRILTVPDRDVLVGNIPNADDSHALGSATVSWADLFLASGGVINFANGNYTVTHSSGALALSGSLSIGGGISGAVAFNGAITPSQITADQNDYAPTGHATSSIMRISSDAYRVITGIAGGAAGRILILHNVGTQIIDLADESGSSTAANRMVTHGSTWARLQPKSTAILVYDGTSSRWRVSVTAPLVAGQSNQESASGDLHFVSPSVQQYHPSAAKCWGQTTGAGTPVLTTSYNVTSITDAGTGRLTVTIETDFSSANWAGVASAVCASNANRMSALVSKAAGSVELQTSSATTTLADPGAGWDWAFFGDQ